MVDKVEQMEKMKTVALSQEEEITSLIEEKQKKLLIKSSLDDVLVKMEGDNDMFDMIQAHLRKIIETEVVADRRVEQQRVGLENMKSRAELLKEKSHSE